MSTQPMEAYAISDIGRLGIESFEALLAAVAPHGPALFQVREKTASDRDVLAWACRARGALPRETRVIVNGRPDIAMAAGADGVQLPSDGLPLAEVRRAFPRPFLIGVSVHAIAELAAAAAGGADFAVLAPIYAPLSKAPAGEPLGPEALDALPHPPALPVFALGGMTLERVRAWPPERARRVAGVAGIEIFHRDPAAVAALREIGRPMPALPENPV